MGPEADGPVRNGNLTKQTKPIGASLDNHPATCHYRLDEDSRFDAPGLNGNTANHVSNYDQLAGAEKSKPILVNSTPNF